MRLLSTEMSTLSSKAGEEGTAHISERYLDEPSSREQDEVLSNAENSNDITRAAGPLQHGVVFKVYKRRWFGLAQLTLLNIMYTPHDLGCTNTC